MSGVSAAETVRESHLLPQEFGWGQPVFRSIPWTLRMSSISTYRSHSVCLRAVGDLGGSWAEGGKGRDDLSSVDDSGIAEISAIV